jgi:hypothetical protein
MLTLSEPRAARERPADLAEVSLPKNVAWIDLLRPEPDEVSFVKRTTGLDVPSIEDLSEIESSSRLQPVDLVDHDGIDLPAVMSASSWCKAGRSIVAPENPPSSLSRAQAHPAFVPLAVDEGLAGFALPPTGIWINAYQPAWRGRRLRARLA